MPWVVGPLDPIGRGAGVSQVLLAKGLYIRSDRVRLGCLPQLPVLLRASL